MDGNLTLAVPILLSFTLSIVLLFVNQLIISYNCPTVTSCELVSTILVSPLILNVVAAINSVIATAFSGMLFNFYYRN